MWICLTAKNRLWVKEGGTGMDWITIIAAIITAGFAFLGVYVSNRKQAALVAYRLEKLEAKVDKHNNVVERMYRLEEQVKTLQAEMKEIKKG